MCLRRVVLAKEIRCGALGGLAHFEDAVLRQVGAGLRIHLIADVHALVHCRLCRQGVCNLTWLPGAHTFHGCALVDHGGLGNHGVVLEHQRLVEVAGMWAVPLSPWFVYLI